MTLPKPKIVFFDWDGTLVDSFGFLHAAHNYARKALGIPAFTLEDFAQHFGKPREMLYVKIYGDQGEEAKKHFEEYVTEHHVSHLKPLEGAEEVLQLLKHMKIPCGVVTNKKRAIVEAEIENFEWGKYFDVVVGAADAANDKPAPDPLLLGISRAEKGLEPQDVWFVGDTENDTACSNAVGSKTILILDKEKEAEKATHILGNYDIDLHLPNCKKFHEFLLQYA
ncbi:MAG: HAD family hydrolase [Alphaproteobacteria bacterium]|nr:HAD family hydrolase [Alphaproteobacteria bacterium]